MVSNINDRTEVERFLRNADAAELLAEREHIQELMENVSPNAPEALLRQLAARITYELRFRAPSGV
jgi:hypothetical protein